MGAIPHLNELRASFAKDGLRILAITSEDAEKIEPFVPQKGITYSVGLISEQTPYGSGGIPHAYLVAPDGTVAWEGHPASLSEGEIEKHLKKVKDFYLRPLDAALKSASAAFQKGDLGAAESLAKDGSREAEADAQHILGRVEKYRAYWKREVEEGEKIGSYDRVFAALDLVSKHFKGTVDATWADTHEKELKADPAVKKELAASKELDKIAAEKAEAGTRAKKIAEVADRLEKFLKKHEGLKTAERAKQMLEGLKAAPH